MSNFLRGGQVTAHRFRMTLQVMWIIMRIMLIVMAITIFLTVKSNVSSYEWQMVPAILKKYAFQEINPDKIVSYPSRFGYTMQDKIRHLENNETFRYVEYQFYLLYLLCLKRIVWVIAFSIVFSILFFWFRGRSLQSNTEMRGSFLVTEHELIKQATRHNKQFQGIKPYVFAGVPYIATGRGLAYTPGEQAHTLVLGATGSGKTKIIQDVVRQLDSRGAKAVIVDIKGDYISQFYDEKRGDIILNPLDMRGSNWSFFSETDALRGFDTIAKTLMPDEGRDPFWVNAARRIFGEISILYSNDNLSLSEFANKILNADIKFLEKLLSGTQAKHLVDSTAEKTVTCVLMMLSVHLAPFRLYNRSDKIFSISKWIKDAAAHNFLFISTSTEVKGTLNPLTQMQVDIAINALCSIQNNTISNNRQIWFILDELPYFDQGLPNLKDGLTMSRSFGGAFVLGTQDMSSLSKIYGHDLSRVIANNCRNKLIMNVDDSYTAKWCSELLGDGEIEEWHEGISYGAHEMRDGVSSNKIRRLKRTVLPAEFSQLQTGEGYLKLPGLNVAKIKFKDYHSIAKTKSFIEDISLKKTLEQEMHRAQEKRAVLENTINSNRDNITEGREIINEMQNRAVGLRSRTETIVEQSQRPVKQHTSENKEQDSIEIADNKGPEF